MMMFYSRRVYIFPAVVFVAIGAVHRSRVVRWTGAVSVREGDFPTVRVFVGWSHDAF